MLSKKALTLYLYSDPDNYYSSFTKYDLRARKVSSIKEYLSNIKKSVSFFSTFEKQKIRNFISQIDEKMKYIKINGFDGEKATRLPWIIGCVIGDLYEDGLPHTRNNVIILPRDCIDIETLIHEKVHVYQKIYKEEMKEYLKQFEKEPRHELSRANPDIDNWIYSKNGKRFSCVYRSKNPKSIQDVVGKYEHPFEILAENVTNLLLHM